jgi:hypothetical protein
MSGVEIPDIFGGVGIEVSLNKPEDFLKVKETLTRIGVSSSKSKTLYQSCHILHKRGRYVILHFKELFTLDGKESTLTEDDVLRRNLIVDLLDQWGLVEILTPESFDVAHISSVKVVPFNKKSEWNLMTKYNIGKK